MNEEKTEVLEVLPWENEITPESIKLTLTQLDEFGLPLHNKRGVKVDYPQDRENYKQFAKGVGTMVEKTILLLLGDRDEVLGAAK